MCRSHTKKIHTPTICKSWITELVLLHLAMQIVATAIGLGKKKVQNFAPGCLKSYGSSFRLRSTLRKMHVQFRFVI